MILMYHNIAEDAGFNTVSAGMLRCQIEYILGERRIVSPDEYAGLLDNRAEIGRTAMLSFDDGYVSFQTRVLPVLEQYGVPAVLFVPVNHVGGTNSWESPGAPVFNLLDWDALGRLSGHELVTIGSHGLSHRRLRSLAIWEQREEIIESRRILESRLGCRVAHFSYPFGQRIDFARAAEDLIRENGYRSACSTLYGRSNGERDRYCLRRVEVRPQDSPEQFKTLVETDLHLVSVKQRIKEIVHQFPVRGR